MVEMRRVEDKIDKKNAISRKNALLTADCDWLWVSANTKLKDTLLARADALSYTALVPKKIIYSMDNAAMIGIRAYYQIRYATA